MLGRGDILAVLRELVAEADRTESHLADVLDRLAERATTPAVLTAPKAKTPPEAKPTRVEATPGAIWDELLPTPAKPKAKPTRAKSKPAMLSKSPAVDRAQEIVLKLVADGKRHNIQEAYDRAEAQGISKDTLDCARRRVKVDYTKTGSGLDTVVWIYRTADTASAPIRARQVITDEIRAQARQLRSEGYSLKEIGEKLGLGSSVTSKGKLLG